jgi:hypothetical protein
MRKPMEIIRTCVGAILFAAAIFLLLAAPGFLSDASSTVPIGQTTEAAP